MRIPVKLYDALDEFTDSVGLLQNHVTSAGTVASGNGILTTAQAVCLLSKIESKPFSYLMPRWHDGILKCELEPGLFDRHPLSIEDQESIDDYVGLGLFSDTLNRTIAQRILTRARTKPFMLWGLFPMSFYLKNEKKDDPAFDKRAALVRNLSLEAHLEFAAGEAPHPLLQLAHIYAIAFHTWKNEDEPILTWCLYETAKTKSPLVSLAGVWFNRRLRRKYPGGMAEVFTIYYGENHPLAELAWECENLGLLS